MNKPAWPNAAIVLGLCLLVGSPLLLALAPTQAFWTEQDQAAYQKAAADFHASTFQLPSQKSSRQTTDDYDPVAAKLRYAAAKTAYEKEKARLASAQARPGWLSWALRGLGAVLIAAGLIGYFKNQASTTEVGTRTIAPRAPLLPAARAPEPPTTTDGAPPSPTPPGYNERATIDGPPPRIGNEGNG